MRRADPPYARVHSSDRLAAELRAAAQLARCLERHGLRISMRKAASGHVEMLILAGDADRSPRILTYAELAAVSGAPAAERDAWAARLSEQVSAP